MRGRAWRRRGAAFLLLLLGPAAALAAQVAVVVNRANLQELDLADVRAIYTDKVTRWRSGWRIAVYHLPADSPAAEVFARRVLGMSAAQAATEEARRRITNAMRNPTKTKSARLVAAIVAKRPNAIGYVPLAMARGRPGLRIVAVLPE